MLIICRVPICMYQGKRLTFRLSQNAVVSVTHIALFSLKVIVYLIVTMFSSQFHSWVLIKVTRFYSFNALNKLSSSRHVVI